MWRPRRPTLINVASPGLANWTGRRFRTQRVDLRRRIIRPILDGIPIRFCHVGVAYGSAQPPPYVTSWSRLGVAAVPTETAHLGHAEGDRAMTAHQERIGGPHRLERF